MFVGILQVELTLPERVSMKERQRIVRSTKHRLRQHFQVAVAEVGFTDRREEATLGIALVSNEASHVQRRCQRILNHLDKQTGIRVADHQMEIL